MSSIPKKSAGGPKTAEGKHASSKNALVYGATSNNPFSSEQKSVVAQYVHELMAYYKPESLQETLQVQRIALCKAKLDGLCELEQVKLQIAADNQKTDPKMLMGKVYLGEDLTRSFARTLSDAKPLEFPMDLTPQLLSIFSEEIRKAGCKLDPEDDLYTQLPKLDAFITAAKNRLKITGCKVILRIGITNLELFENKNNDHAKLTELMYLGMEVMEARARCDEVYTIKTNKTQVEEDRDTKKINEALFGNFQAEFNCG
jgi:hypothetical protein